ncbi:MAG: U3 small nucleolar RNA-associated protein 13, partial [Phylliscum demangeonii]
GRQVIDDVLASLADDQLYTLLLRLRDWNTNARTAPVAQRVLWVLFQLYPVERFVELDAGRRRLRMSGGGGGVEAGAGPGAGAGIASQPQRGTGEKGGGGGGGGLFDALRAYTERHYTRLSDLMDESYLLEYTLSEMDGLGAVVVVDAAAAAAADDDHRDDGRKRNGERDGDADGDGVEAMDVVGESGAEEEDEDDVDVDVDGEGDGDGDGDHDVVMSSAAL